MTRAIPLALLAVVLLSLPHGLKNYGVYLLTLWTLFAAAALGLNLTLGYAGQVSLAQAAFLGIGAYVSALLTTHGISFWVAVPAAGVLCFLVGVALGFPALRVQHHYLAFVTLGFNVLVFLVLRNEQWLTGGTYGVEGIPRPALAGFDLGAPIRYYYLCLAFLVLVSVALWWLLRSPWGRAFRALRENPLRAASLGIDVRGYTLLAFAIGAAVGGLAGAFYAPLLEFIDPTPFNVGTSLSILLMVIVGGSGHFAGPFLGAALVVLLPEWLRFSESGYLILYALLVMVLMALCPGGLTGLGGRLAERFRQRRANRAAAT